MFAANVFKHVDDSANVETTAKMKIFLVSITDFDFNYLLNLCMK